jgi:hypothetical protein
MAGTPIGAGGSCEVVEVDEAAGAATTFDWRNRRASNTGVKSLFILSKDEAIA